jgi:hypothetical protein
VSGAENFNPMAIVEAFNRHHVDYVVIGGFAAELHDAPVRPTRDIDFTPSTTAENLTRVSEALSDLGARIRTEGVPEGLAFSHDGASLGRAAVWNLTSDLGELDISFRPSGTEGYDDLVRDAIRLDVRGQAMPVASLADVIRSKEAAGREKDLSVLGALQRRLTALEGVSAQDQAVAMARLAAERVAGPPPAAPEPRRGPRGGGRGQGRPTNDPPPPRRPSPGREPPDYGR